MKCQRCGSERILCLNIKCPDGFEAMIGDELFTSPDIDGISSSSEYVDPDICLDCGQVQGEFPVHFEYNEQEQTRITEPTHTSLKEWIEDQKNHKCDKKELVCADDPMAMMIGTVCVGCGKEFNIRLPDVRVEIGDVDKKTGKLLRTAQGRQDLLKSWQ